MNKILRITTVPISLRILLKGQLKYMSSFFEVKAISSEGKLLQEVKQEEGVDVIPINMSRKITPFTDLVSLIKLIILFKKEKPNIVHTHTPKAGLLGMLAAYLTKIPVRMHTVAGMPLTIATGFKKKLLVFIEKLTYACATNVYPNSSNLKEYIIDNNFCKQEKLKIIGKGSSNGIDTEYFEINDNILEEANKKKSKFNLPKDAFVFLFVGRIVKDKGINELVRAFIKLKNENSYLVLVGDYEENLNPVDKDVFNEIKNNNRIIEAGFQKDVRPYFAMANVFVFPSYREGFPNVVMQAGAMELPSIVSNINGCNEIISDNKNGLIINVQDENDTFEAMEKLLNDIELTMQLKKKCRKNIIDNYERTYIWEELRNEYNSLLKDV